MISGRLEIPLDTISRAVVLDHIDPLAEVNRASYLPLTA